MIGNAKDDELTILMFAGIIFNTLVGGGGLGGVRERLPRLRLAMTDIKNSSRENARRKHQTAASANKPKFLKSEHGAHIVAVVLTVVEV